MDGRPRARDDHDSDFAALMTAVVRLDEQQRTQAQQIDILRQSTYTLTQQIAQVTVTQQRQDRMLDAQAKQTEQLAAELRANTTETAGAKAAAEEAVVLGRDLRDLMLTGRALRRVAIWIGGPLLAALIWGEQAAKSAAAIVKALKGGP